MKLRKLTDEQKKLAETCIDMVHYIAGLFIGRSGYDVEDGIFVGYEALLAAAFVYDSTKGASFATYAYDTIYLEIRRAIPNLCSAIHVPVATRHLASMRTIGRRAGISTATYMKATQPAPVQYDSLPASVKRHNEPEVSDDCLYREDEIQKLKTAVENLLPLERYIIERRFGIGCEIMAQREIGEVIGKSKGRAEQLETQVLEKLQRLVLNERDRTDSKGCPIRVSSAAKVGCSRQGRVRGIHKRTSGRDVGTYGPFIPAGSQARESEAK